MEIGPVIQPTSRRIKAGRVLGTLLSLALLVYLIWLQGWDAFFQALSGLSLGRFLLALGLVLLSRLAVSLRWFILLRSARGQIGFAACLRLVFTGLFVSNFLPSTVGGDLARLAGAVALRLDAGMSAASLVVDRLVGIAGMALVLPFGLVRIFASPVDPVLLSGMPLAFLPSWLHKLAERVLRFFRSLVRNSMYWLRNPASLGGAFACTFAHMAFTFLAVDLLIQGMGNSLSFWTVGGLWSISYFISLLPVTINGLGFQEVSIATLYSQFGGVSPEAALALAVLLRMLFLLASLPGALFLPEILQRRTRRNPVDESG